MATILPVLVTKRPPTHHTQLEGLPTLWRSKLSSVCLGFRTIIDSLDPNEHPAGDGVDGVRAEPDEVGEVVWQPGHQDAGRNGRGQQVQDLVDALLVHAELKLVLMTLPDARGYGQLALKNG